MADWPATAADLRLMEGYPAPPEKQVMRENLMSGPYNRWGFQHMRELMATCLLYTSPSPRD